LLTRYSILFHP